MEILTFSRHYYCSLFDVLQILDLLAMIGIKKPVEATTGKEETVYLLYG